MSSLENITELTDRMGLTDREFQDALDEGVAVASVAGQISGKNLWSLDTDKGVILYAVTRVLRPSFCVETGVGPGVSSTFFLSALEKTGHGHLHSIDIGEKYGEEAETYPVGFLVPEELKNRWTLHVGDSRRLLVPLLNRLRTIDLFLHDSSHETEHVMFELTAAWRHMKKGIIFVDNSSWTDAPELFSRNVGTDMIQLSGKSGGFCAIVKGF
ncbi:MAG: class I SAM-dependent methyltransferase [Thermoplasmata archaeon]|uniref:Class I SAM-dependent methyltransferase n=1 Tax=Candidatus Sysuiplasma superficiale TaxID=2823368 RepID=A0A8J7YSY1_9ARCH|nr:class I SAM-dependent methyltransferase [Candidatus Sysuiplasma superficiale]MBX8644701.1 class I SAM-dependent methyltransferase [Candidatus Sysuiplasma superficiale]